MMTVRARGGRHVHRVIVMVIFGMLMTSGVGAAEDSSDRQAVFFGAGGSWAMSSFDGLAGEDYSNAWGLQFRGGYRFLPNLSVECVLQYVDRYALDLKLPDIGSQSGASVQSDIWALDWTVGAKGGIPVWRFYPYAEVGVGVMVANDFRRYIIEGELTKLTERDTSFVSRFTLGTDFAILDWLGSYAEVAYVLPAGSNADRQSLQITAGLRLLFARPS